MSAAPKRSLPAAVRRDRILEYIRREESAGVGELAVLVDVSPVTIHRDLGQLQADGLIRRIHGGARPLGTAPGTVEAEWAIRLARMREAKHAMAIAARALIAEDSSVFLDASSTCFAVLKELERDPPRSLRLVTNSPAVAASVHSPPIHVVVLPGELDQGTRAIVGPWAAEFLRELSLDLALVSGAGFNAERGLTTTQRDIADVLRAALAVSQRAVALVDSSKVGRQALITCAPAHEFEAVICDAGLDPAAARQLRDAGVALRLA
jgi:DeoR/GlpR family transcriptional regulator of sugar metabolism